VRFLEGHESGEAGGVKLAGISGEPVQILRLNEKP